jgi:hypothetical protein
MQQVIFSLTLIICTSLAANAQKVEDQVIRERIAQYKNAPRGPYKDIRWFCKDGTFALPKERCAEPGAVQRARYKDEVVALARSNHIFLGQILSTTPREDFWDSPNYHSRLKQYQLEKFLRASDDGWILRKGQFYRGAYQVEDEEAWGIDFFTWLLSKDAPLQQQYYLLRQAVRDIPHKGDDNKTLSVRAVSKAISDAYPPFMDLRVKIHGQPEAADVNRVRAFREKHADRLSPELLRQFDILLSDMKEVYQPANLSILNRFLKKIPKESAIYKSLATYINQYRNGSSGPDRVGATADMLLKIRQEVTNLRGGTARLALLDISNALETMLFADANAWQPGTLKATMEKIIDLARAAVGTGLIEMWEWEQLQPIFALPATDQTSLEALNQFLDKSRSIIEWGTGMVNGTYKNVVYLYSGFEPLASGFFDDRIRSSVLLPLGNTVGTLGEAVARESNLTNKVVAVSNPATFRGLNPGYAKGELVVVADNEAEIEVSRDKIYVFFHPPSDLKPVAGILTVTEGNMVSHVQLLARNLGIPNAVLSAQNMSELNRFAGEMVFYAVSNRGTIVLKPETEMTDEERALFKVKARSEDRISVPVEQIDLGQQSVLNMRQVNAASSGRICGPKAANLGQLKALFPDHVVEGLVLPFGVFRVHMDQAMPGQFMSYWAYLNQSFQQAKKMMEEGKSEAEIETYTLKELGILREAIKKMELMPSFLADLEANFRNAFGNTLGKVPVFIRSDTNMEDLKDFTGAGLNLTLFNVVDRNKILQGIRDVWASAYTERSFKWRQRYLLNPENVFPSILIIPSVDVDCSGVLITKGIPTNDPRDLTIAFSRGAGGAVDGQAAESYLVHHQGENRLLSPAREPSYRRLPTSGGSTMMWATFEERILSPENLKALRLMAGQVQERISGAAGVESDGPWDVELGFKDDKIWLFQIRPFVENKNAVSSTYLESISPQIVSGKSINLEMPVQE